MLYDFSTVLYRKDSSDVKVEKKVKITYDSSTGDVKVFNETDKADVPFPAKISKDYNGKRQELPALDALIIGQLPIWAGGQIFETEMTIEGWTKDELTELVKDLPEDSKEEMKFKGKCEFLLNEKGGLRKVYGFLKLSSK